MTDICCCCGEYVGEGRQVCAQCMSAVIATDVSNTSTSASDKTILHITITLESSKPS
jgi:hypothetical protein